MKRAKSDLKQARGERTRGQEGQSQEGKDQGPGGEGPEFRLPTAAGQGDQGEENWSVTVTEVSPWLWAMFLIRMFLSQQVPVHSPTAEETGPGLRSVPSGEGTGPTSGEPLPPETEYHARDKQEGPRRKCLPQSAK